MSAATQLAAVEAAIEALLTGTPVSRTTAGGVDLTYMSLSELRQWRRELMGEVAREAGPIVRYSDFGGFRS